MYTGPHTDLVEACRRGERKAQFELYRLYARAMYNTCLRMCQRSEDAEDLLQNAFAEVFHRLGEFRGESAVGAWIKRIVVNHCINHLKKRRLLLSELSEQHERAAEPDSVDEEAIAYGVEAIRRAVQALPDGYRVVFSLYALEGYDHQEIAEILGIAAATSKSQYSRARRRVQELLRDDKALWASH